MYQSAIATAEHKPASQKYFQTKFIDINFDLKKCT